MIQNRKLFIFLFLIVALLSANTSHARETIWQKMRTQAKKKKWDKQVKKWEELIPDDFKKFPSAHPRCGNNICEVDEDLDSCKKDCGIGPAPYHKERHEFFTHEGKERSYIAHVPPCYRKDKSIPVVLNFHGGAGTGETAEIGIGQMNLKADEACFMGVYPNGLTTIDVPGKRQHWNTGTRAEFRNQGTDDVAFVAKILDHLESQYNIDTNRIYATGISNGAMMSYRLACELSDRIAAVAPVGGGMVLEECHPKRPVSIIHFHGTADPGWPYNGGNGCFTKDDFKPVSETISRWQEINQCDNKPTLTNGTRITSIMTYACAQNTDVTLWTIKNGGHTWPGGYAFPTEQVLKWDDNCPFGKGRGVGKVSDDISALDEMWEFFRKHPLK